MSAAGSTQRCLQRLWLPHLPARRDTRSPRIRAPRAEASATFSQCQPAFSRLPLASWSLRTGFSQSQRRNGKRCPSPQPTVRSAAGEAGCGGNVEAEVARRQALSSDEVIEPSWLGSGLHRSMNRFGPSSWPASCAPSRPINRYDVSYTQTGDAGFGIHRSTGARQPGPTTTCSWAGPKPR